MCVYFDMAGTILENLSGKKLTILVVALLVCQLVCFLIGGLIGKNSDLNALRCCEILRSFFEIVAPVPASVQNILGTACKDVPGSYNDTSIYLYSRGDGKCVPIEEDDIETHDVRMANQIVFVFQVRKSLNSKWKSRS